MNEIPSTGNINTVNNTTNIEAGIPTESNITTLLEGAQSFVSHTLDTDNSKVTASQLSKREIFKKFQDSLEAKYNMLRKIKYGEKPEISENELGAFISSGILDILPLEKVSEFQDTITNLNKEIDELKIELEEDLKKGRINTKRLQYLMKLEKDSKNLFKLFGRVTITGRIPIKEHLEKFKSKYDFDYSDTKLITKDIETNSPSVVGKPFQDKIQEGLTKIKEIQGDLNSYTEINGKYVRLSEKGENELPENFIYSDFRSLLAKVNKEIECSRSSDQNSLTMQLLNLQIKDPENFEKNFSMFKELVAKVNKEIECSRSSDQNSLTMQLLNLIKFHSLIKFQDFAENYSSYKSHSTESISSDSGIDAGDILIALFIMDLMSSGVDISQMDSIFEGDGGEFGGGGATGDFGTTESGLDEGLDSLDNSTDLDGNDLFDGGSDSGGDNNGGGGGVGD